MGIFYSLTPSRGTDQWMEATLYTFQGVPSPDNPESGLTITLSGHALGVANSGGTDLAGAVFELVPPTKGNVWSMSDPYSFGALPDGGAPIGGLTASPGGEYYGITEVGGTGQACNGGCGTVYRTTPPS